MENGGKRRGIAAKAWGNPPDHPGSSAETPAAGHPDARKMTRLEKALTYRVRQRAVASLLGQRRLRMAIGLNTKPPRRE